MALALTLTLSFWPWLHHHQNCWPLTTLKGHTNRLLWPVGQDSPAALNIGLKNHQKFYVKISNRNFPQFFGVIGTRVMCARFRENQTHCRRSSDLKQSLTTSTQTDSRGVRNRFFICVRFRFGGWNKIGFGTEWVLFGSVQKTRFDSDIIVIYYSCNE